MTTKKAIAIVNGMTQNLAADVLEAQAHAALVAAHEPPTPANVQSIVNEYRQHAWDVEDLTGPVTPAKAKATPKTKATPKAKVKTAAKAKAKTVAKKSVKAKRIDKNGNPIVAYPKPEGRTAVMFACVLAGASNADSLALIQKQFGKSSPTNIASIGWVRSQLRNNPDRWMNGKNGPKYGCTSKLIKGVKADKDCTTIKDLAKRVAAFTADDSDDEQ